MIYSDLCINKYSLAEHEYEYLDNCVLIYLTHLDIILSLNATATHIWEQIVVDLQDKLSIDEALIVRELMMEFEVNDTMSEIVKEDVNRIINDFFSLGLLVKDHGSV